MLHEGGSFEIKIMETILIATDFSDVANNAADYAVELAKLFAAKIVLVNTYNLPYSTYETGASGDLINVLRESSIGGLNHLKKRIEQNNKNNFEIECYSDFGFAEDMIIETANKVDADLIVIGITGDGGKIKENIIGSTAIKVARNTDISVLIIPDKVKYHPIHKISFACDLNKTEEGDLIYVSRYFGKLFNAELEVVNVEEPGEEFSKEKYKTYTVMNKKLETVPHKNVFITEKKAGKALDDYFNEHPTDVVMVNPHKHNLFHNLFSHSISKELAFHCKTPLLCVH
jgi:nucleotide-binding universal stress UspA family protein